MDWIDEVVQDVAELDYNSPADQPSVMLVKPCELRAIIEARTPAKSAADDLMVWACERWREEVQDRPLVNVRRDALDTTWRQVVRYAGGDPDALLGPSHAELRRRAATASQWQSDPDNPANY